jgi:geranylgeranyl pyrophosphate synthase
MGNKLTDEQITSLQNMFHESGAIAFGKTSILEYSQKARDILTIIDLNEVAKQSILVLIKKMEQLEH